MRLERLENELILAAIVFNERFSPNDTMDFSEKKLTCSRMGTNPYGGSIPNFTLNAVL